MDSKEFKEYQKTDEYRKQQSRTARKVARTTYSSERRTKIAKQLWSTLEFRQKRAKAFAQPETKKKQRDSKLRLFKANKFPHWAHSKSRQTVIDKLLIIRKKTRKTRPSGLEKSLISLCLPNLEYTGNGKFWTRFEDGSNKNPDFIVRPFRKNKKVIEVFGGIGWIHSNSEAQELVAKYKAVGIECLMILEKEILSNTFVERVKKFCLPGN